MPKKEEDDDSARYSEYNIDLSVGKNPPQRVESSESSEMELEISDLEDQSEEYQPSVEKSPTYGLTDEKD